MCLTFIFDLWLLNIILNSTELKCTQNIKLYHFVHTILSVPFCPIPFCLYTILSVLFCPYHFVRYHFVRSPFHTYDVFHTYADASFCTHVSELLLLRQLVFSSSTKFVSNYLDLFHTRDGLNSSYSVNC